MICGGILQETAGEISGMIVDGIPRQYMYECSKKFLEKIECIHRGTLAIITNGICEGSSQKSPEEFMVKYVHVFLQKL